MASSSGASLVVAEQTAEARRADDLFAGLKRIVNVSPSTWERPIANRFMRPERIAALRSKSEPTIVSD